MSDKKNIFTKGVELPEVVEKKAKEAFAEIRKEGFDMRREYQEKKKRGFFSGKVAVAACVCILAAGSITAVAAVNHFWSRGMQGNLQATQEEQKKLLEKGVAEVISEKEAEKAEVTSNGVTVKPMETIVDGKYAYLSFSVEGYQPEKKEEPFFESVDVYLESREKEKAALNVNSNFYDGIVPDENGKPVYEDGTPLKYRKDGSIIAHYQDENGTLEYVIVLSPADKDIDLTGRKIHVDFSNLGTVSKASYENRLTGEWDFTLSLSGKNVAKKYQPEAAAADTGFVVDTVELSPISVEIYYTVQRKIKMSGDDIGIPEFSGVVLKDGTFLRFLANGGSTYLDENMKNAYERKSFDRVLNVDEVRAILLRTEADENMIEIPLEK